MVIIVRHSKYQNPKPRLHCLNNWPISPFHITDKVRDTKTHQHPLPCYLSHHHTPLCCTAQPGQEDLKHMRSSLTLCSIWPTGVDTHDPQSTDSRTFPHGSPLLHMTHQPSVGLKVSKKHIKIYSQ